MGLLDDFSAIFAPFAELGEEIRGIKDDFISNVVEPVQESGQELKDRATNIVESVSGSAKEVIGDKVTGATDAVKEITDKTISK